MPAGTTRGDSPHGPSSAGEPSGSGEPAAQTSAPERKVVRKIVRRRKGTSQATSPARTHTGGTAASAPPEGNIFTGASTRRGGRADTAEGDGLSDSTVQLLEMVLYYVSDVYFLLDLG